jgi:small subunit ribosomal protein S9
MAEIADERKNPKKEYIFSVGKNKEAVARLRLYQSVKNGLTLNGVEVNKGEIYINNKKLNEYFGGESANARFLEPFKLTNTLDKFTLTLRVKGGGKAGQLDAAIHAIARALSLMDPKNRQILKKRGFLTRDARVRERRKVGMGGKARRKRQSPKR